MPITYKIDHERRLVQAAPCGRLTHEDMVAYQTEVWSQSKLAGYNELIDMSEVTDIAYVSNDLVRSLADLSASLDSPEHPSKFAIVASDDLHFGLGRMYNAFRDMARQSTRQTRVFRTRAEAEEWLQNPLA